MQYDGHPSQRLNIQKALIFLRRKGYTEKYLAELITSRIRELIRDKPNCGIKITGVSRSLIDKYMNARPDENGDLRYNRKYAEAIFMVLASTEELQTKYIHNMGLDISGAKNTRIVAPIMAHYNSQESFLKYTDLGIISNDYAMFRPIWSSNVKGKYIRSLVSIRNEGGLCTYREEQNYFDHFSQTKVEEIEEGYVIIFLNKMFILTKENDNKCMKFIVIDNISSKNAKQPVDYFNGFLIAVAHPDPSPGYPFICRRIQENDMISRIVDYSELDELTQDFFSIREKEGNAQFSFKF